MHLSIYPHGHPYIHPSIRPYTYQTDRQSSLLPLGVWEQYEFYPLLTIQSIVRDLHGNSSVHHAVHLDFNTFTILSLLYAVSNPFKWPLHGCYLTTLAAFFPNYDTKYEYLCKNSYLNIFPLYFHEYLLTCIARFPSSLPFSVILSFNFYEISLAGVGQFTPGNAR